MTVPESIIVPTVEKTDVGIDNLSPPILIPIKLRLQNDCPRESITIGVNFSELESSLPFHKVRYPVQLIVEGRQYEKNFLHFCAACCTRETWLRPRPSNPAMPPKRPSLVWPQLNMKLSTTSDVMVSLSLLKYPTVYDLSSQCSLYTHCELVEHFRGLLAV